MIAATNSNDPASFGWTVAGNIVPYTYHGPGSTPFIGTTFTGGIAYGTNVLFDKVLSELVPLIDGGLVTGMCSGFVDRNIAGTNTKSFHAYGLALDINYPWNGRGLPKGRTGKYVIPDAASTICKKYGLVWGGDWSYTDPMHIEIHLSPDGVAAMVGGTAAPPVAASVSAAKPSYAGVGVLVAVVLIGLLLAGMTQL